MKELAVAPLLTPKGLKVQYQPQSVNTSTPTSVNPAANYSLW